MHRYSSLSAATTGSNSSRLVNSAGENTTVSAPAPASSTRSSVPLTVASIASRSESPRQPMASMTLSMSGTFEEYSNVSDNRVPSPSGSTVQVHTGPVEDRSTMRSLTTYSSRVMAATSLNPAM